jgi:hypothetical protein
LGWRSGLAKRRSRPPWRPDPAAGDAVDWFQKTPTGGNGLPPSNQIWIWKEIGKSFLLAVTVAFSGYLLLALSDFFFKTDFRIYVFAVKLKEPLQFRIYLVYLIPFFIP